MNVKLPLLSSPPTATGRQLSSSEDHPSPPGDGCLHRQLPVPGEDTVATTSLVPAVLHRQLPVPGEDIVATTSLVPAVLHRQLPVPVAGPRPGSGRSPLRIFKEHHSFPEDQPGDLLNQHVQSTLSVCKPEKGF